MSEQIVSARGLRRTYTAPDGTLIRALDDVSLDVYAGELTVIAGPSGSGKSTLLQVLAGLDRPDEGTVQICGEEVTGKGDRKLSKLRRQRLGFVFQSLNLIDSISARENIALPLRLDGRPVDDERLTSLATTFGIAERLDFLPSQMSGGQQQRVAVARALMASPDVVFADEPTAALDPGSARQIVDVLSFVAHEHGHAVVVISHDPMVAARGDRVFRMTSGQLELITEPGSTRESPWVDASVGHGA